LFEQLTGLDLASCHLGSLAMLRFIYLEQYCVQNHLQCIEWDVWETLLNQPACLVSSFTPTSEYNGRCEVDGPCKH